LHPSSERPRRILVVEPWLGGSHEAFWAAWAKRSAHQVEIVGLPGRQWKWRMRAGAWELARKLVETDPPDLLVVSDYLELPAFYGFLGEAWSRVPGLVYFHENQLTYPGSREVLDPTRDLQFGFTNVLSCLRAAGIVFNSRFHRRDFEAAARELLAVLPHPNPREELLRALSGARVIPPGVEIDAVPLGSGAGAGSPLRVLYNHRWEHDKDPAGFLRAVRGALDAGARLELVLLGERFDRLPEGVASALGSLEEVTRHRGYVPSRDAYVEWLGTCDLAVSTARHEFFGIATLEAMCAGATPLLPDRLSYPELVGERLAGEALYPDEATLERRLVAWARAPEALRDPERRARMREVAGRWSIERTVEELDALARERFCP